MIVTPDHELCRMAKRQMAKCPQAVSGEVDEGYKGRIRPWGVGDRRNVEWVRVLSPQVDEPQGGTGGWEIPVPASFRHCSLKTVPGVTAGESCTFKVPGTSLRHCVRLS